jgi:hypothetical protein
MGPVKTLVKQVCHSKKVVEKLYTSKAQMNSVGMELTAMTAQMKLGKRWGRRNGVDGDDRADETW